MPAETTQCPLFSAWPHRLRRQSQPKAFSGHRADSPESTPRAVSRLSVLLAATVLLAALAGWRCDPAPAARTPWQWRYQVWMPPVWQRIARCESGSNPPNWQHNSGTYQGAFGFHYQSWDGFRYPGYPTEAYLATPWQQYQVALRIHARYGFSGWGCYRLGWVRG